MNIKKVAIIANCNIPEKLSAAMSVAKKIEQYVDEKQKELDEI